LLKSKLALLEMRLIWVFLREVKNRGNKLL